MLLGLDKFTLEADNLRYLLAVSRLVVCLIVALDTQRAQGGAPRRAGGREERPPRFSSQTGRSASPAGTVPQRWIPPSKPYGQPPRDYSQPQHRNEAIFRHCRGVLNKLTPEKFDKLSLELLNCGIENQTILKGIILLIFEKALDEPKYSALYAQLCLRLAEDAPNFDPPDSNACTFRRLLLNKCQDEFENRSRASNAFDRDYARLTEDEREQYHLAKSKMLGNIKFISELAKLQMLHEGILHKCIKQLLEKKKHQSVADLAEDLECLCQIMKTIGRRLDTNKAKSWMDTYFHRIDQYAISIQLPSRIRFMLQDVIELRRAGWVPRLMSADNGPRTITQIREEAARDLGIYMPPPGSIQRPTTISPFERQNGISQNTTRGGIDALTGMDVFGTVGMGTGPGVITMDAGDSAYNSNRNKQHYFGQTQYGNFGNFNNNRKLDNAGAFNGAGPTGGQSPNRPQNPGGQQYNRSQQPQNQNRDLPPRFKKTGGSNDEISLRPARNFNLFKPSTPSMLPMSAQIQTNSATPPLAPPPGQAPKSDPQADALNPLLQKQAQITIKQASTDKEKHKNNRKNNNQEQLLKSAENLLTTYLDNGDQEECMHALRCLKVQRKVMPRICTLAINMTLGKEDQDRDRVSRILCVMKAGNMVSSDQFMEGFTTILTSMTSVEADVPLVRSHVARFGAQAVQDDIISLLELSEPMEHGNHYPLFMLCLQQMAKLNDQEWLYKKFTDSKINLQNMLPECESADEMMIILEERGLSFLFPLLRIQSELMKQMALDASSTALYKWLKDNVDEKLFNDKGFIHILASCLFKYITRETSLADGMDPNQVPDKAVIEMEREMLTRYKGVLHKFLHEHSQLQLSVLYALQVHCHNNNFPKGMLLRFFMCLYDLEIVEEDVFFKWKEEVNDEYPGKGKALFQVNQWLTWLEQAEEESDDEN